MPKQSKADNNVNKTRYQDSNFDDYSDISEAEFEHFVPKSETHTYNSEYDPKLLNKKRKMFLSDRCSDDFALSSNLNKLKDEAEDLVKHYFLNEKVKWYNRKIYQLRHELETMENKKKNFIERTQEKYSDKIPEKFKCEITNTLIETPIKLNAFHTVDLSTYDKLQKDAEGDEFLCPFTRTPIVNECLDEDLKKKIDEFKDKYPIFKHKI